MRQGALHLSPSLAACAVLVSPSRGVALRVGGGCGGVRRWGPSLGLKLGWGGRLMDLRPLARRLSPSGQRYAVNPLPDTALCIRQCRTDGRVPYTRGTGSSLGRPSDQSPHFRANHLGGASSPGSLSPRARCPRPTCWGKFAFSTVTPRAEAALLRSRFGLSEAWIALSRGSHQAGPARRSCIMPWSVTRSSRQRRTLGPELCSALAPSNLPI